MSVINSKTHNMLVDQAKLEGIQIGRELAELERKLASERPNLVRMMAKQDEFYREYQKGTA